MCGWSIVTQSERPSSCPTLSPKLARVRSPMSSSLIFSRVRSNGYLSPYRSRSSFLFLGNTVDEDDLLRNSIFRDDTLVGEHLEMVLDARFADAIRIGWPLDHERQRPLAPFVVLDADDGGLRDPGALRDQVLDLQRRNPLAAGLDHVLDAVGDVDVAVRADHRDVAGVQVAPAPELLGGFGTVQISLGQRGRTQHDLAGGLAIMRHVVHVGIDDAQIHERPCHAGPGAEIDLSVRITSEVLRSD